MATPNIWSSVDGEPVSRGSTMVIFAAGQSNILDPMPFAWTPNPAAHIWNNTVGTVSAGSAFVPLSNSTVTLPQKFASDVADANPGRQVYLIVSGFPGQPILHWLSGTGTPDAYQDAVNNIVPALAAVGVTKIDVMLWWQGEANTLPITSTYAADFTTMMGRFWSNSWFPRETPVMVHAIASNALNPTNADADNFNSVLQFVTVVDPDTRRFVYTPTLSGATYWDVTNPGHMTGQGYFSAGAMSAREYLRGVGRSIVSGVIRDPATGNMVFGKAAYSAEPYVFNNNANLGLLPTSLATVKVVGADGAAPFILVDALGSFTNYVGRRANGTLSAPTALALNDLIVGLGGQGRDSVGYVSGNKAAVSCFAAEAWNSATNHGTFWSIFNTIVGTNTTVETTRFEPGAITIFGTTSGTFKLTVPAAAGAVIFDLSQLSGSWISYSPTVTAQTPGGTPPTFTVNNASYWRVGKTVTARADVTVTAAGTGSAGVLVALPFTAAAFGYLGTSKEIAVTGVSGAAFIAASGTTMNCQTSVAGTYIVTGQRVLAEVTYEVP